jgi:hypothetical protein
MYLSELMSDMHTSLPMPMNMKPVEMFEVNVLEIEELMECRRNTLVVIEESYEVQHKARYAFVFLLRARLITYVYPPLLIIFYDIKPYEYWIQLDSKS